MRITIKRRNGRSVMRITAENKRDQKLLAEGIRRGLGIKVDSEKGETKGDENK